MMLSEQADTLAAQETKLRTQRIKKEQDIATARSIRDEISPAQIDALLEPVSPKLLHQTIEAQAALNRLCDLSYHIATPEKWDGGSNFSGIEGVMKTTLSLTACAAHDGQINSFLAKLLGIKGKLTLDKLTITRTAPAETSLGVRNIYFQASFTWVANAPEDEAR